MAPILLEADSVVEAALTMAEVVLEVEAEVVIVAVVLEVVAVAEVVALEVEPCGAVVKAVLGVEPVVVDEVVREVAEVIGNAVGVLALETVVDVVAHSRHYYY